MCGILAVFNKEGVSKEKLKLTLTALKQIDYRGPDGEGCILINTKTGVFKTLRTEETPTGINCDLTFENYEDNQADLFLGHRRLSILDLSINGHQPMMDKASGNWITFNGEIYNYIEIRNELISLGYSFLTQTDTEVLLKAYLHWGKDCLQKFNGMWAFVIWDNIKKQLFISNDRFGVKPIYHYQDQKGELIICSEVKQVTSLVKRRFEVNRKILEDFLLYRYQNYDENTFLENVFRFRPSHYISLSVIEEIPLIHQNLASYYSLPNEVNRRGSIKDIKEEFRHLLKDAVRLRMRADVPYAFALSGGLDSSAILYFANEIIKEKSQPNRLETFSIISPGHPGDESAFMKMVESDIGLKANYIQPIDSFQISAFERHIYHQDQPVHHITYFAEYALAQAVSQKGFKILMIGQGADEIFAGYHEHFYQYAKFLLPRFKLVKLINEINRFCSLKNIPKKRVYQYLYSDIKQYIKYRVSDKKAFMEHQQKWLKATTLSDILKLDLLENKIPNYLHADDRDGMAFGIESRHPFLDYRVVNFGFSLPDNFKINKGWQKSLIRDSMHEMPDAIRYRKDKKGFTTPQDAWLNTYKEEFQAYLAYLNRLDFPVRSMDEFSLYALGAWIKINNI